jgi:hypothetical protein
MITSRPSKMIIFTPGKMITSSTLENNNIHKNDHIDTIKNEDILYTGKLYSFLSVL